MEPRLFVLLFTLVWSAPQIVIVQIPLSQCVILIILANLVLRLLFVLESIREVFLTVRLQESVWSVISILNV